MNTRTTMMQIPRSTAITTSKAPAGIREHVRRDATQVLMQQEWPGRSNSWHDNRVVTAQPAKKDDNCMARGYGQGTASLSLPKGISHHFPDTPRPLKAVPWLWQTWPFDNPRNIKSFCNSSLVSYLNKEATKGCHRRHLLAGTALREWAMEDRLSLWESALSSGVSTCSPANQIPASSVETIKHDAFARWCEFKD